MLWKHKAQLFIITLITLALSLSTSCLASNLPVPLNTEETKEEIRLLGDAEYTYTYYESDLEMKQIKDFYRRELPILGWREKKLVNELKQVSGLKLEASVTNLLEQQFIFEKGEEILIINFIPALSSGKGKLKFILAQGKSAFNAETLKEGKNFVPVLVAKPNKDVFPVYPGASLVSLSEPAGAITASYFTPDDIEAVSEFYKARMSNYDWSLVDEKLPKKIDTSLNKEDIAKYCPSCAAKTPVDISAIETWVAYLYFAKENQDICNVVLSQIIAGKGMPAQMNTTIIMVNYEERKE